MRANIRANSGHINLDFRHLYSGFYQHFIAEVFGHHFILFAVISLLSRLRFNEILLKSTSFPLTYGMLSSDSIIISANHGLIMHVLSEILSNIMLKQANLMKIKALIMMFSLKCVHRMVHAYELYLSLVHRY